MPFAQAVTAGLFAGKISVATQLDALGTNSLSAPHFYENTPPPFLDATVVEYAFVRRLSANGLPQDTQNNTADFLLIAPSGETINGHAAVRGGLNPRNSLTLPLRR